LLHVGEWEVQRYYTMPHQIAAISDADRVIVLTGIEGRELEHMGVPRERIVRLGAGIDMDQLQGGHGSRFRNQQRIEGPLVSFIGAATDDKGAVHLVQAMQSLWSQGNHATLVIAGRPIKPSSFDRIYDELPESQRSRIRRLGPVSDAVKQDLLAASDLFVMPSRVDSFGIVYLEAWAYGVPVIGCRAGGVPDVIDDEQDGLLVPFGEPSALASAIERLLADPELRQQMGRRGCAKVLANYTWEHIYGKLRTVYQTLVDAPAALGGAG
jgi:glycosyltransferase involved in cell wall biosynthesis